jgi:fatty-acyl-CoA synthase
MTAGKRAGTTLPAPPLMHGTGLLAALTTIAGGGTVVLIDAVGLDAARIWREIAVHEVRVLVIVGDVFARPLLDALGSLDADVDVGSLQVVSSSGTIFSAELKTALLDRLPALRIVDSLGATEGMISRSTATRDAVGEARFVISDRVAVFTADGVPVAPGSGQPGYLGVAGRLPLGYYKDDVKSASTFRVVSGRRYSMAGDMATVDADGTIVFLGRGSATINTGGEKVFPEEVEAAMRELPGVVDCCVVGLPDEQWGQRVVAVAQVEPAVVLTEAHVVQHLRARLAGYKVPKSVVLVPSLERGPNGKVDYHRIKELAATSDDADAASGHR